MICHVPIKHSWQFSFLVETESGRRFPGIRYYGPETLEVARSRIRRLWNLTSPLDRAVFVIEER